MENGGSRNSATSGAILHPPSSILQPLFRPLSSIPAFAYYFAMLRRTFGDANLEVSVISLGCWIFGVDWWGHYTDERAMEVCSFSHDQGITYFDNGDAYGNGRAETLFGK